MLKACEALCHLDGSAVLNFALYLCDLLDAQEPAVIPGQIPESGRWVRQRFFCH
jgi:hypothetical protein